MNGTLFMKERIQNCEKLKTITTIKKNKSKISLVEEFNNYNGQNLAKEFCWDEDKGKECIEK